MKKTVWLLLFLPLFGASQKATVSGVVTYFFNSNQGDKPDIGAKVYLIDSAKASFFNLNAIDSFQRGNTYKHLYLSYQKMYLDYAAMAIPYKGKKKYQALYDENTKSSMDRKADADRFLDSAKKYDADNDEIVKQRDVRIANMLMNVNEDNALTKTVDATGNYSINCKPGSYIIYIRSKNRTSLSMTELQGQVYCKKVVLKEDQNKDVSNNFEVY